MRLASILFSGSPRIAARNAQGQLVDLTAVDPSLGTDVGALIRSGSDWKDRAAAAIDGAQALDEDAVRFRPLVPEPPKLICLGLNDVDHAHEANLPIPDFPVVFSRVASSLIGHNEPMLRPPESHMLDYEIELAVVIGTGGRRISEADALSHVAGYTIFNDGTIRDVQVRNSQWTLGKNFHGTGALGPELVTPDVLPEGASGLRMTTRVGDEILQDGNTGRMIFSVAQTIALLSIGLELQAGDVIAMGTPSGIGFARKPQRFLSDGEVCIVEIEQIGTLVSPVVDEVTLLAAGNTQQAQPSA